MRAGGAFALFSLLKRQAGLGMGGRTAALDRMLAQYSTGPVRSGSGASPRAQRRRSGGQGLGQGQGQGLGEGFRPQLSAASRSSAHAQHDWRQRLIAVSRPALRVLAHTSPDSTRGWPFQRVTCFAT